jgi:hypothetical protein
MSMLMSMHLLPIILPVSSDKYAKFEKYLIFNYTKADLVNTSSKTLIKMIEIHFVSSQILHPLGNWLHQLISALVAIS